MDFLIHDDPLIHRAIVAVDALPLPKAYRDSLLWMSAQPSTLLWERLYHTIPVRETDLTLWEAVAQVDPVFPQEVPVDEQDYARWTVCPTREAFVDALEFLTR
jgi:hypothetical protein